MVLKPDRLGGQSMASILLVIAIAAMGLIIFWYVFDEAARGGQGKSGLLGMSDPREAAQKSSGSGWRPGSGKNGWRARRD
jgi:hypothetical protein